MTFVYFMRPVSMAGPIKIGCSKWPDERLLTLTTWSPFPLEIVAKVDGDYALERRLHARFAGTLSHREWFHASRDLLSAIAALQRGEPIEKAVDFSIQTGVMPARRWLMSPERKLCVSYQHKLRHAAIRASRIHGERRFLPAAASSIIERWAGWRSRKFVEPLKEELEFLDAILREPSAFCISFEERWPTEARAS